MGIRRVSQWESQWGFSHRMPKKLTFQRGLKSQSLRPQCDSDHCQPSRLTEVNGEGSGVTNMNGNILRSYYFFMVLT
jgi:hypothetical protein